MYRKIIALLLILALCVPFAALATEDEEDVSIADVLGTIGDGALGLAWEAGDYDEIVFARITLEELGLTGGTPTLVARAGRAGAAKPPEVAG